MLTRSIHESYEPYNIDIMKRYAGQLRLYDQSATQIIQAIDQQTQTNRKLIKQMTATLIATVGTGVAILSYQLNNHRTERDIFCAKIDA